MTGEQIYKALNQQYDEGENISFKCLESNISTRKQIIQRKKILTRLLKPSKKMERRLFRQKPIHLSSMTFIWWWDGFSIFKEAKLIGAINPDTEVFVEYLTDLEKAGQTISATITGRKAFVEKYVEEPKAEKGDTAGTTTDTKTPEK